LGKARKASSDRKQQIFLWTLGSALFANVVAFCGISYWDQTEVVWYGLLAAISAAVVIPAKSDRMQAEVLLKRNWGDENAESVSYTESDANGRSMPRSSAHERLFAL
jgi:hypothetical protein